MGDLMVDFSEHDPIRTMGPSRLDLFMTVIRVSSWETTVRWYIDTLGLSPVVLDAQNEFALLSAGSGRLGVQGAKEVRLAAGTGKVRLVFQVNDLEGERLRLIERGVVVGGLVENHDEGYSEVRLQDPEGHSLRLFAWVDPARGSIRPPLSATPVEGRTQFQGRLSDPTWLAFVRPRSEPALQAPVLPARTEVLLPIGPGCVTSTTQGRGAHPGSDSVGQGIQVEDRCRQTWKILYLFLRFG